MAVALCLCMQCGNDFRIRLRAELGVWGRSTWELLVGTPLAHRLDGVMVLTWVDDVTCSQFELFSLNFSKGRHR